MTASEHDHAWCIRRSNQFLGEIARENAGLYDDPDDFELGPKASEPIEPQQAAREALEAKALVRRAAWRRPVQLALGVALAIAVVMPGPARATHEDDIADAIRDLRNTLEDQARDRAADQALRDLREQRREEERDMRERAREERDMSGRDGYPCLDWTCRRGWPR